jgi:hypothetical protein
VTQIGTRGLENQAVTAPKLGDIAGDGCTGGSGSKVSVQVDSTGGANLATAVAVSANGVAVKIDDDTITENGSNQLAVGAGSIGANEVDESGSFTWTGTHDFTGGAVSVGTPTLTSHAVTKSYADALRNGIQRKGNCRALATVNQTLSGLPSTIDGVTSWLDSHRIMLVGQTDAIENGPWVVHSGAWTRPDDFAVGSSVSGSQVWIDEGVTYQDTMRECTNNDGLDVVGTDDLVFVARPVGEVITDGTGLTKDGTTLHIGDGSTGNVNGISRTSNDIGVAADGTTLEVASNIVQIKDSGVSSAKIGPTSVIAAKLGSDVAGGGLAGGNGNPIDIDINGTTAETSPASDDEIHIYDASAGELRKMTRANFLAGVGASETSHVEPHLITSTDVTNHYFTLAHTPSSSAKVMAFLIGGITQVNKQLSTTAPPDFDVLNDNQFHFKNGAATGLSEFLDEGDELIISYAY